MLTPDALALLADARLPGDARVMGLALMRLGEGWHEVTHDQWRALLSDGPSDDTIRRHLRRLEGAGWVEADSKTGRRPPRYRVRGAEETPSGALRDALRRALPLTPAGEMCVSPAQERGNGAVAPHHSGAKDVQPSTGAGQTADVVVGGGTAGGDEEEERAREPLHPQAAALVGELADTFDGCRDSLRDYLRARVPPPRQYAYIRTLQGWLNGIPAGVWRTPEGGQLEEERRVGMLAGALNELLQADESAMSRPVGDAGNLKTKLGVLIRQEFTTYSPPKRRGPDFGDETERDRKRAAEARARISEAQREEMEQREREAEEDRAALDRYLAELPPAERQDVEDEIDRRIQSQFGRDPETAPSHIRRIIEIAAVKEHRDRALAAQES